MKSRTELLALAEDAKAKGDELRLAYSNEFAGKAELTEEQDTAAAEARAAIQKQDNLRTRYQDEAALVPELNAEERKHDDEQFESDPFLRYMAGGWENCSAQEQADYGGERNIKGELSPGFAPFADVIGNPRLERARPASGDRPTGVFPVITEDRVFDALKYFGGIRQCASVLTVSDGNIHKVPQHDAENEEGLRLTAENTQAAVDDYPEFTDITVEPFTYTSRKVVFSKQYLQDARVDVMGRALSQLMRRLGRVMNSEYTNTPSAGAANTKPEGLLTGATAGITAASGTAFTWQEVLRLTNSIDVAYLMGMESPDQFGLSSTMMGRVGFMCHQNVWNFICQMSADGRPILPRQDASNISDGLPRTLFGFPVILNNNMPGTLTSAGALTSGEEVLLFGDFGQYQVTDVANSLEIKRLEGDTHAPAYQVAAIAFLRSCGIYTGRKEAVVKLTLG